MFKRQFICSALVVALGMAPGDGIGIPLLASLPTAAPGDVVTEWNAVMLTTTTGQNPFSQARFAAITHAAIFEAVNAITGQYQPYLGTIQAPPGASPEAAAVAAAHAVLLHYFPTQETLLSVRRADSLGAIADGQSKTDGIAVGEAAAAAMIALRANDGSSPPQFYLPLSSNAGEWQLTPACPAAGGLLFHWQNVTPFGIQSGSQFRSAPPPALTSSTYTKDYEEVKIFGAADSFLRAPDRSDVAQFYNVVLAVPVWNRVAQQLAVTYGSSLAENARAFALINMAISDGLVASMDTKYHYNLWRPETAIRHADADGNPATDPDTAFTPLIATPCFPSYPSAHASASYAARRVVQEIWGAAGHSIELNAPSLNLTLQYTTLKQITSDIDDARVYGGIHFRFDQEAGARQGWRISDYIMSNRLQARLY
jgi:hypothetical protein